MKKTLSCLYLLLTFYLSAHAQGYNGLIARWSFNGNANDVSGNGLNGVVHGATLTAGYNGITSTAYYFNGTSDYITVPYNSLMNTNQFSICALVKPEGFYSGTCQGNSILYRGGQGDGDFYFLEYSDNPYESTSNNSNTNTDCGEYDPTQDVFEGGGGIVTNSWPDADLYNTPTIAANTWYCVVLTDDGDSTRIYVDGTLRTTFYQQSTFTSGTDGISIGADGEALGSYPYWLNGTIDEIRLYNRVLSPTEVAMFCDSVEVDSTTQPCLTNSLTINTGYNPITATAITAGANGAPAVIDPHWTVTSVSPDVATAIANTPISGLVEVTPGNNADVVTSSGWSINPVGNPGSWISCLNADEYYDDGNAASVYNMTLSRSFRMCSDDSINLSCYISDDNYISALDIDGITLPFSQAVTNQYNYSNYAYFTQTLFLTAGTHTINVEVDNFAYSSPIENPTGLDIYGIVSSVSGANSLVSESSTACNAYVCTSIMDTVCNTINLPDTLHACSNTTVNLNAVVSGPDSVLSISWTPTSGLSNPGILNPVCMAGTNSVNYHLTVQSLLTNGDTCITADSVYVAVSVPDTTYTHTDTTLCNAASGMTLTGPSGYTSYLWSNGNTTATLDISAIGSYWVSAIGNCGLLQVDTFHVSSPDTAYTHTDTALCATTSGATLAAPVGYTYLLWSNGDTTTTINVTTTGIYWVSGVDNCNSLVDTFQVTKLLPATISVTGDTTICYGDTAQLGASQAVTYLWTPAGSLNNDSIANPIAMPRTSTLYIVAGTDSNGCIGYDSVTVNILPPPVLEIDSAGTVSCNNSAVQLNATGAVKYRWQPAQYCNNQDIADPVVSPATTTIFYLTGYDAAGCSAIDSIQVEVIEGGDVIMPNAFTPNGDGINDVIYPIAYCDFTLESFSVYNRWGQRVFFTNTYMEGWDGKFNGIPQPVDVFVYYITGFKGTTKERVVRKGNITLIR